MVIFWPRFVHSFAEFKLLRPSLSIGWAGKKTAYCYYTLPVSVSGTVVEKSYAPFSSGGDPIWNGISVRGNASFSKWTNSNGSSRHKKYCYWFIFRRVFVILLPPNENETELFSMIVQWSTPVTHNSRSYRAHLLKGISHLDHMKIKFFLGNLHRLANSNEAPPHPTLICSQPVTEPVL